MTLGLVLSAVTIGFSFLTDKTGSRSRQLVKGNNNRVFLSGARTSQMFEENLSSVIFVLTPLAFLLLWHILVLGTGITLLVISISQQFRLSERLKALWHRWMVWECKADAPLRLPSSLEDDESCEFLQKGTNGSIQLLVSTRNAATWRLNVSLLSLAPGREIPSRMSQAVEFYYVLRGRGQFSVQGVNETLEIQTNQSFIVDPDSMRWISNTGSEPLVLLRATDGGSVYDQKEFDVIRQDPNRRSSTMDVLRDGLRHVQIIAKDYVNGSSE